MVHGERSRGCGHPKGKVGAGGVEEGKGRGRGKGKAEVRGVSGYGGEKGRGAHSRACIYMALRDNANGANGALPVS